MKKAPRFCGAFLLHEIYSSHCPHGSFTIVAGFCPSENVISCVHVLSPLINCMVCLPDVTLTYPTLVFPTSWPSMYTDATGGTEEMKTMAGFLSTSDSGGAEGTGTTGAGAGCAAAVGVEGCGVGVEAG
jgi:hypothetical protein